MFPVFEGGSGHPQSIAHGGVGVDHLPAVGPTISFDLLQQLRHETPNDDEGVFKLVTSHIEPLPVLKDTLNAWISELPEGSVCSAAKDACLALQADLWCERVSAAPKAAQEETDFLPLLLPLPAPLSLGSGGLFIGFGLPPSGYSRSVSWDSDVPSGLPADCASCLLQVPAPVVAGSPFWQPCSCPLRRSREHVDFVHKTFAWLGFVLHIAQAGHCCEVLFPFSRTVGGVLAEWLDEIRRWSPEPAPLSFRFTA